MKKLYALDFHVGVGNYLGPMIWSQYPDGVELVNVPVVTCDEHGADIHIVVRCEPEIGKRMCWVPFDKPAETEVKS